MEKRFLPKFSFSGNNEQRPFLEMNGHSEKSGSDSYKCFVVVVVVVLFCFVFCFLFSVFLISRNGQLYFSPFLDWTTSRFQISEEKLTHANQHVAGHWPFLC